MKDQITDGIAVYILCGGKSTRMKAEKGLVEYQGKAFLQWILEAVLPLTNQIKLVTQNEAYAQFGFPLIGDLVEDKGPVGGIYTALADSKIYLNLILSCDIPKISTKLISHLIQSAQSSKKEVSMLTDGIHDYPLIACYRKSVEEDFKIAIKQDHLKLCALVESLSPHKILISSPDDQSLQNINSNEELKKLNQEAFYSGS